MNKLNPPELAAALQKAYRLLAIRPHSEHDLGKRLQKSGFPDAVVKEALEKLHDLQYLNDVSFTSGWAWNLAVNKLQGNRKIIASLREKGAPEAMIKEALDTARQELSEEKAVERFIQKKKAAKQTPDLDRKEKQRIFQSLMGRGFPPDLILNKLQKQGEEKTDGENGE